MSNDTFTRPAPRESDEAFEDVRLQDDTLNKPKKRSFLSRFGETNEDQTSTSDDTKHRFSLLPGRKRGQSGTGSELEPVQRPGSKGKAETIVR